MAADDGLPQLAFASAADWEAWLEANHDSAEGVWLKLAKKGSGIASVTLAEALDLCLCFGWIDGRREALDDAYYLQRYTPRRPRSNWSTGRARQPARRPTWTSRSSRATARPGCSRETSHCSTRRCRAPRASSRRASPRGSRENARLDPAMHALTAPEVRGRGAARAGTEAAARLAERPAWLHIDLDVLDEGVLPAVSYPQSHGLDWDELVALVRPAHRRSEPRWSLGR